MPSSFAFLALPCLASLAPSIVNTLLRPKAQASASSDFMHERIDGEEEGRKKLLASEQREREDLAEAVADERAQAGRQAGRQSRQSRRMNSESTVRSVVV